MELATPHKNTGPFCIWFSLMVAGFALSLLAYSVRLDLTEPQPIVSLAAHVVNDVHPNRSETR